MRHLPLLMCTAFCGLYSTQTKAADTKNEKPNILWLTFEDTSAYEFGCYGNRGVHTPNADSLAARGIQFMNAWSVAPQSSAARSSLITGCYSSTYGMDIHPVPYDTPADIFFPQKLREAGYYCTNNSKTHYNSTTDNKICWDECSNKASYNSPKRKKEPTLFRCIQHGNLTHGTHPNFPYRRTQRLHTGRHIPGTAFIACLCSRLAGSTFRLCRSFRSSTRRGYLAGILPERPERERLG